MEHFSLTTLRCRLAGAAGVAGFAAGRSVASWRLKKTEESKRDTEREGKKIGRAHV